MDLTALGKGWGPMEGALTTHSPFSKLLRVMEERLLEYINPSAISLCFTDTICNYLECIGTAEVDPCLGIVKIF